MAIKLKTAFMAVCLSTLSAMAACAFQVEHPEAMQTRSLDYQITDNNRVEILVIFNRKVDMATLNPGINIYLATEKDRNVDFKLTAGATPRSVIITTAQPIQQYAPVGPDAYLTLNLLGTGPHPIRSASGMVLDGDNSGRAGGDYETTFYIPVAWPPAPLAIELTDEVGDKAEAEAEPSDELSD